MTRSHEVTLPLYARFIRLHAEQWHQLICLRVELVGCKGTLLKGPCPNICYPFKMLKRVIALNEFQK